MNVGRTFVDTNILVYAFTSDELQKRKKALLALDNCITIVSTQVIREFSNTLFNKTDFGSEQVKDIIGEITSVAEVVCEEIVMISGAIDLREKYKYSFYDSLIISAALSSNCEILLSEDMQNGQLIEDKLQIVNPFMLDTLR